MRQVSLTLVIAVTALAACQPTTPATTSHEGSDMCGASRFQHMVGGPSRATISLDIPADSRHYGSQERVATNDPSRLNFVHSGTAVESVTDPNSTVIRVFCG